MGAFRIKKWLLIQGVRSNTAPTRRFLAAGNWRTKNMWTSRLRPQLLRSRISASCFPWRSKPTSEPTSKPAEQCASTSQWSTPAFALRWTPARFSRCNRDLFIAFSTRFPARCGSRVAFSSRRSSGSQTSRRCLTAAFTSQSGPARTTRSWARRSFTSICGRRQLPSSMWWASTTHKTCTKFTSSFRAFPWSKCSKYETCDSTAFRLWAPKQCSGCQAPSCASSRGSCKKQQARMTATWSGRLPIRAKDSISKGGTWLCKAIRNQSAAI